MYASEVTSNNVIARIISLLNHSTSRSGNPIDDNTRTPILPERYPNCGDPLNENLECAHANHSSFYKLEAIKQSYTIRARV
jgi:hypothetical protein